MTLDTILTGYEFWSEDFDRTVWRDWIVGVAGMNDDGKIITQSFKVKAQTDLDAQFDFADQVKIQAPRVIIRHAILLEQKTCLWECCVLGSLKAEAVEQFKAWTGAAE